MTVDEIKENVSMREVLSRYGITPNRSGMCSCPMHIDKKPSMKIYKDGFKCFSCNRNGDVFSFVMNIENCDFKTAFLHLGGSYEQHKNNVEKRLIQAKFDKARADREKAICKEKEFRQILEDAIWNCKEIIVTHLIFSDAWCLAQNKLPWLCHVWDEKILEGNEVNEIDVFRVCKQIRCFNDSVK